MKDLEGLKAHNRDTRKGLQGQDILKRGTTADLGGQSLPSREGDQVDPGVQNLPTKEGPGAQSLPTQETKKGPMAQNLLTRWIILDLEGLETMLGLEVLSIPMNGTTEDPGVQSLRIQEKMTGQEGQNPLTKEIPATRKICNKGKVLVGPALTGG